jgi:hypothetical protein
MLPNPASRIAKSELWGFEITHLLGAIGVLAASNFLLSLLRQPTILSWIGGLFTLALLRLLSVGQKPGHLQFLMEWLGRPHVFLGARLHPIIQNTAVAK